MTSKPKPHPAAPEAQHIDGKSLLFSVQGYIPEMTKAHL